MPFCQVNAICDSLSRRNLLKGAILDERSGLSVLNAVLSGNLMLTRAILDKHGALLQESLEADSHLLMFHTATSSPNYYAFR
jgi:hypothetical protein